MTTLGEPNPRYAKLKASAQPLRHREMVMRRVGWDYEKIAPRFKNLSIDLLYAPGHLAESEYSGHLLLRPSFMYASLIRICWVFLKNFPCELGETTSRLEGAISQNYAIIVEEVLSGLASSQFSRTCG